MIIIQRALSVDYELTTYIYYITDKNRSVLVPGVDKLIILNELKMVDNEETLKQWTGAFINVMTHF